MDNRRNLAEYCAIGFFIWATVIVQLYCENRYFNLLQAKANIYLLGVVAGVLFVVFCLFLRQLKFYPISLLDFCIIAFGIIAIVASFFSLDPWTSLTGFSGWGAGGIALASFALFYLVLSRYLKMTKSLWTVFLLVTALILIVTVLNSAGIDIATLHNGIRHDQFYWYVSTIGNLNWYVGYLCLTVPAFAVLYMESQNKTHRFVLGAFLFLACINMVLTASDGLYLGVGCCMFALIPYVLSSSERLCRFCLLPVMYGVSLLLVRYCPAFSQKATTYSGLSETILFSDWISFLLIAVGITLYVVCKRQVLSLSATSSRIITVISESMLGTAFLMVILVSIRSFNYQWGTERGYIWKGSMEIFSEFDIIHKLLGVGPEMLYFYYSDMFDHFNMAVSSSHSTPVQFFLTTGILGIAFWVAIWVTVIAAFVKKKLWNGNAIIYAACLFSFLGQSMVYSTQVSNLALLCIMMSLFAFESFTFPSPDNNNRLGTFQGGHYEKI